MLCKHFHRAQGGQCAVLENAKTRPQKRKMAIFKQGRQKGYKSAHLTSRESQIQVGICYHQQVFPTVANTQWVFSTVVNTH